MDDDIKYIYDRCTPATYINHKITGRVFVFSPGRFDNVLVTDVVCFDEIKYKWDIVFPVENRLTVNYRNFTLEYITFNLKNIDRVSLLNPSNVFIELQNLNSKWKLAWVNFHENIPERC